MGIAVKPQLRRATCLLWETVKNTTRAVNHRAASPGDAAIDHGKRGRSWQVTQGLVGSPRAMPWASM